MDEFFIMRDGISIAHWNNGAIMRALLAPVISRATLILVQTFIQTLMTFLFRSKAVISPAFSRFIELLRRRWDDSLI